MIYTSALVIRFCIVCPVAAARLKGMEDAVDESKQMEHKRYQVLPSALIFVILSHKSFPNNIPVQVSECYQPSLLSSSYINIVFCITSRIALSKHLPLKVTFMVITHNSHNK